ncbi:MAG TPA: AsmA family protein, partial [Rhizomicrobium sp.]|nr:AsmA family protein [Rhizomicrobium sp.]
MADVTHQRMHTRESWQPPAWLIISVAIALVIAVFLLVFQWNWLRAPVARYASRESGREVQIAGNLKVHLFSWHPSATVEGLTVSNPAWAPSGDTLNIPKLYVQTRLGALLHGQVSLMRVVVTNPHIALLRDRRGRANWELGKTASENAEPLDLPPIKQFLVENGQLEITDLLRRLRFTGTISSQENAGGLSTAFWLTGDGTLNNRKFQMHVTGGPLINIERSKPYDFDMDVSAGTTHVEAKGAITHPFNLGQISAAATFSGPNFADLYDLTGLALPGTPPYRVTAHITRYGRHYTLSGLQGRVGRTDLAGWASVDMSTGHPYLEADLHSTNAYLTDMGPLFGARPPAQAVATAAKLAKVPVATATREIAQKTDASHLLPDFPLNTDRLRQMDAKVNYRADKVISADFPLHTLMLKLTLQKGVLTLDPVSFAFAAGKLSGMLQIDARNEVPSVNLDARLQNVNLDQFAAGKQPLVKGVLEARAKVHGTGNSVHKAASTMSGTVVAVVPQGTINQRSAELLGIDVDRALFLPADKETNLRCAVGGFQAQNGVLTTETFLVDTDVVKATGTGTLNLRDETVDMQIKGEPKKFTFFRLRTPITVTGPIAHPTLGVKAG